MGLMGLLIMAYCGGLQGILSGLTKSTDHPSRVVLKDPYGVYTTWSTVYYMV